MKLLNKLKSDRQNLINSLLGNIKSLERIAFEQQAEIERLQKEFDIMRFTTAKRWVKEAKIEAYNEFAYRLTDKADLITVNAFDSKWVISQDDIDNLKKELTEGNWSA